MEFSTKLKIYYVLLFLYSFIFSDLTNMIFLKIGPVVIYFIDLIYLLVIYSTFYFFKKKFYTRLDTPGIIYLFFLGWLIYEVIRGFPIFGFRSIGEARYIASLFLCFIPPYLFWDSEQDNFEKIYEVLEKTIIISGLAGLIMFIIEFINGGRFFISSVNVESLSGFEDARGIRYLDVYHIFNMLILAVFLYLKMALNELYERKNIILIVSLVLATLITQGRTSIIAIAISFLILLLLQKNFNLLFKIALYALLIFIAFLILFPETASSMILIFGDSFKLFQPADDITGTTFWRWAVNIAALEQAFQTFWLGQAYGGYFAFEVPLISHEVIEFPPHNMYIMIFLKAGIIGLIIMLIFLLVSIFNVIKKFFESITNSKENLVYSILVVIFISQIFFAFAYGFVQPFGLYIGFTFLFSKNKEVPFS